MFEWIVGFWLILLSWVALPLFWIPICLFGIFSDYRDNGFWAGVWMILGLGGLYLFFRGSISNTHLIYAAIAYIPIGVVWSFYRFHVWSTKRVAKWNKAPEKERTGPRAEGFKASISATNNKSDIVYWMLFWPPSVIANLLDDFIRMLESLVTKFFKSVYARITQSAVAKMKVTQLDDRENV